MAYRNECVTYLFNDINAHINEEHTHRTAIALFLLIDGLTDEKARSIIDLYTILTDEGQS